MDADARAAIGERGESWFKIHISQFGESGRPLFRATHLGGKWPTVDYLVEALGTGEKTAFCLVQVKSSGSAGSRSIPVTITDESFRRLAAIPVPAYLIGIDDVTGTGYILSVNGRREPVSSVPRTYPIDAENRERLWREVVAYWDSVVALPFASFFAEPQPG
ncbi:MAG TPA: hypothetical protein VGB15_16635 [Longimicrobium sp.]|jgi:hypothetical protein